MSCLIAILSLLFPRFLIFCLAVCTNVIQRSFETFIWPILGFIFMPYTTLVYIGAMIYNNKQLNAGWFTLLIIGMIFDLNPCFSLSKDEESC